MYASFWRVWILSMSRRKTFHQGTRVHFLEKLHTLIWPRALTTHGFAVFDQRCFLPLQSIPEKNPVYATQFQPRDAPWKKTEISKNKNLFKSSSACNCIIIKISYLAFSAPTLIHQHGDWQTLETDFSGFDDEINDRAWLVYGKIPKCFWSWVHPCSRKINWNLVSSEYALATKMTVPLLSKSIVTCSSKPSLSPEWFLVS